MTKLTVISATILFSISTSIGQTIEIGQDAKKIKQIIEWSTNERTGYDSYGNSKGNNVSWDVKYNNGQITDVIQCYSDQYLLDFRAPANFCKHYIMEFGRLGYVLTQYEDLSTEKLTQFYDKSYSDYKSGELYFSEDYKHYSKIYLAKNGYATVEWRKTESSELPANIQANIDKKIKAEQDAELKQQKEEEEKKKKEKEINSKIYDLAIYDKQEYNNAINKQKERIISGLQSISKDAGNSYSSYSSSSQFIPSYSDLEKSDKNHFIFKNSYSAYYYLKDNSRESQDYGSVIVSVTRDIKRYSKFTLVSGDDKNCALLNSCYILIPTIQYQGYEVMTEATINNINVDYIKSITTVKIKNGVITFKKNAPPTEYQSFLSDKLKTEKNGLYIVKYETGKVMDSQFVNTEIKKTKSVAGKILKTTGTILLIAGVLLIL